MQLYYDIKICGTEHTLGSDQSHHAISVMRRAVGDHLNICDGRGHLYVCQIVVADKRAVRVNVESVTDFGEQAGVHLAIAPTKNIERTEWAVEKAVEIGVHRITPIICDRSERKIVRVDRLERIVASAAEQSLKGYLPVVDEPMSFNDFIEKYEGGFIAHCNEGEKISLPQGVANGRILIGPEGDFSPSEVERAIARGYQAVTLGTSRLRTETAAVVAVALLNFGTWDLDAGTRDLGPGTCCSLDNSTPTSPTSTSPTSHVPRPSAKRASQVTCHPSLVTAQSAPPTSQVPSPKSQ